MKKSKNRDTFLNGHARRMRECRQRQREQNLEQYKSRVNAQQRKYRLQNCSKCPLNNENIKRLKSILKLREANKIRQRRYRSNQSIEKKILRQEKDRIYKRMKRNQKRMKSFKKNSTYTVNVISESNDNCDSIETAIYRCSSIINK
jgi:hypothetical protein